MIRAALLSLCLCGPAHAQDAAALADVALWAADQSAGIVAFTARLAYLTEAPPEAIALQTWPDTPGSFAIATPLPAGAGFTFVSCQANPYTYLPNTDPSAWAFECLGVFPGSDDLYDKKLATLGEGRLIEPWPDHENLRSANLWTLDPAPSSGFLRGSVQIDGAEMQVWIVALGPAPGTP